MELKMDNLQTIIVKESLGIFTITLNRVAEKNSINSTLMQELNDALEYVEKNKEIRMVVIEGKEDFFCTGMDFKEVASKGTDDIFSPKYMETLKIVDKNDPSIAKDKLYIPETKKDPLKLPDRHPSKWGKSVPCLYCPYRGEDPNYSK